MEVNGEMRAANRGSLGLVSTIVRDPQPAEFEALLERRRRLGLDLFDEQWGGVYRMNPAPAERHAYVAQQLAVLLDGPARTAALVPMISPFNLGELGEYCVPDGGLHRELGDRVYVPTAALVVEIVSPGDDSWNKLPFYAAHNVDELLIVDPQEHRVHWLGLQGDGDYRPIERSTLVELGAAELAERIDWPR
jgi:Uma2 family endonuclease